jgi:ribulose-5-phosphate 4-epimerase/fuculose-1-phosphate aldolase
MTLDEGYIKYESHWTPGPATHVEAARELDAWRRPLFEAGLIGEYAEHGIGYGNLSVRRGTSNLFLITGTQTGKLAITDERHYSLVTDCDLRANVVRCSGPIQASSEAMTHGAIYALGNAIGAVAHAHSRQLWEAYYDNLPTTNPDVAYGTPAMAVELDRLYRMGGFKEAGVAVMAGHEDGLISFGTTVEEAATRLLSLVLPSAPA